MFIHPEKNISCVSLNVENIISSEMSCSSCLSFVTSFNSFCFAKQTTVCHHKCHSSAQLRHVSKNHSRLSFTVTAMFQIHFFMNIKNIIYIVAYTSYIRNIFSSLVVKYFSLVLRLTVRCPFLSQVQYKRSEVHAKPAMWGAGLRAMQLFIQTD